MSNKLILFTRPMRTIRSVAKAMIFFLKVFPMLPSRPVDWVTKPSVIEKVWNGSLYEGPQNLWSFFH
jgi:hypothetical protein